MQTRQVQYAFINVQKSIWNSYVIRPATVDESALLEVKFLTVSYLRHTAIYLMKKIKT